MPTILRNTDLNDGRTNNFDGWETCAASAFGVVVYTGNWFAAYSVDGGRTFTAMNPYDVCGAHGETLCCDQVVIYIPRIDLFAWLLQTTAGNYVLAVASPEEIRASSGKNWTSWLIPASRFGGRTGSGDYPEVAIGTNFLYLTFNLIGKYSIGLRLSFAEIVSRSALHLIYFAARNNYWLRPAQSTGDVGYFVALNSASQLRIFAWPELASSISHFDVAIATIPTEDWEVKTPSGDIWLGATSKVDWHIYGATRSGSQLWIAWNGARKTPGAGTNTFPYPHIGLAVVDVLTRKLVRQRFIWNRQYAYAWPSLATNISGDVGISYCWGGHNWSPQHGIGMLTGPNQTFVGTSSGTTVGAGGHYTSIRESFPDVNAFCASGFNQIKIKEPPGGINHPHFVLFRP